VNTDADRDSRVARFVAVLLMFAFTLTIRVWGVSSQFLMLGDQIRDWAIASGPFAALPLVGPPTHFSGYTIGPAFYWILWAIRVSVGPWFDNLPHGGGVGQAVLQSGVDALLLAAVWHRTRSAWMALATVILLATASFDLSLAAVIWNPVVGATLAKLATALVLLEWPRRSPAALGVTAGIAWCAVHAYTGAIFVAVGIFVALLVDSVVAGDRRVAWRNLSIIAVVVALLQVPYVAHQVAHRFGDPAMGAVIGSVGRIASGTEPLQFARSWGAYASAFDFIQASPWQIPWAVWVLVACGGIVAIRYRHDPALLAVTLVPQVAAVIGYAFFLGGLEHYYYLSVMPAAVLTVLLGASALPSPRLARLVSIALCGVSLAIAPARILYATQLSKLPEYGALVDGSRRIAHFTEPMRAIRTAFTLPATSDPEYVYRILGGRLEPSSPWVGVIHVDGSVSYRKDE
jgi:hypothetical protein